MNSRAWAAVAAALFLLPFQASGAQLIDFDKYRVPVWQGPRKLPVFHSRKDPGYEFRTTLRREFANGPIVAGHYVLTRIGCGMGCKFYSLGDIRTGKIEDMIDFPISGEDFFSPELKTVPDSRLIVARWNPDDIEDESCFTRQFVLKGKKFVPLGPVEHHDKEFCSPDLFDGTD